MTALCTKKCHFMYTNMRASHHGSQRDASRTSRPRIRRCGSAAAAAAHPRAHLDESVSRAPPLALRGQRGDERGPPGDGPPRRPAPSIAKSRPSTSCRPGRRAGRAGPSPADLGLRGGRASACRQWFVDYARCARMRGGRIARSRATRRCAICARPALSIACGRARGERRTIIVSIVLELM